jgi:hypothetical protein
MAMATSNASITSFQPMRYENAVPTHDTMAPHPIAAPPGTISRKKVMIDSNYVPPFCFVVSVVVVCLSAASAADITSRIAL